MKSLEPLIDIGLEDKGNKSWRQIKDKLLGLSAALELYKLHNKIIHECNSTLLIEKKVRCQLSQVDKKLFVLEFRGIKRGIEKMLVKKTF